MANGAAVDKQLGNSTKKTPGKPFAKGVSGNPSGRPPAERSLTKALRDRVDPQTMAAKILALADDSDRAVALRAATYIYDRLDGTPIQSLRTQADDIPAIVLTRKSDREVDDA